MFKVCLAALMVAGLLLNGCGGGANRDTEAKPLPILQSTAQSLYGSWRLTRVSGGFNGQGYPVTQETVLTFKRDGQAVERSASRTFINAPFRIDRATTQFGGTLPVIDFVEGEAHTTALARVVSSLEADQLMLVDEVADGYQYEYVRVTLSP